MSVDQLVSSDLAVLATENRRAVPSVDAVFRTAGIGEELPTSAALVSMVMPTSASVLAMAQAFSSRVGRATVGVVLFAMGVLTIVVVARMPWEELSLSQLLVNDFVLGRHGFVLALVLLALRQASSRVAASVFRVAIESARTDAAAKEAGARLLRRVDTTTFALGLVGLSALMMIGGFLWFLGFRAEPDLGAFVYPDLPPAWRAIELFAVFGGGLIATLLLTRLVRRETRSPRASRIVALLADTRVALVALALCIATVAVIKLAPQAARWTDETTSDFEVTTESMRSFSVCRPDCVGADMNLELIPGSYGSDRLRIALTFVGGVALFVLATGLALRRRRREHEL
jgi:hypothetical protein